MSNLYYTEIQIKIVRALILTMMGLSLYQALTIRRLLKNLRTGRRQFDKVKDATKYLINIIEEHGIELNEFDVIALTNIAEETHERQ